MEEGVDTLSLMKKSLMQNYVENLSTLDFALFYLMPNSSYGTA